MQYLSALIIPNEGHVTAFNTNYQLGGLSLPAEGESHKAFRLTGKVESCSEGIVVPVFHHSADRWTIVKNQLTVFQLDPRGTVEVIQICPGKISKRQGGRSTFDPGL